MAYGRAILAFRKTDIGLTFKPALQLQWELSGSASALVHTGLTFDADSRCAGSGTDCLGYVTPVGRQRRPGPRPRTPQELVARCCACYVAFLVAGPHAGARTAGVAGRG